MKRVQWLSRFVRQLCSMALESTAITFISVLVRITSVTIMDMDTFFDASTLKLSKSVALDEAPLTAQQYLAQVALDRQRCPDMVVARNVPPASPRPPRKSSRTLASTSAQMAESIANTIDQATLLQRSEQESNGDTRAPPRQWQTIQVRLFDELRAALVTQRDRMHERRLIYGGKLPDYVSCTHDDANDCYRRIRGCGTGSCSARTPWRRRRRCGWPTSTRTRARRR